MRSLDVALDYTRRGWYTIPLCWPTAEGKCACGQAHDDRSAGKAPLVGRSYQNFRADEKQVREWWAKWPGANVGLLLEPSGLFVIDLDGPEAAKEADELGYGDAAIVRTGSGLHLYYTLPAGVDPGRQTHKGACKHIDILAKGYVVAPPSVHRTGKLYAWATDRPLAEPPGWAVAWLRGKSSTQAPERAAASESGRDAGTLVGRLSEKMAAVLRDGFAGHYPSRSEAVFALVTACVQAGMTDPEAVFLLTSQPWVIEGKGRPEVWILSEIGRARAKGAVPGPEAALEDELRSLPDNLSFSEHKASIDALFTRLADVKSPVSRDHYINLISTKYGWNKTTIRDQIKAAAAAKLTEEVPEALEEPAAPDRRYAQHFDGTALWYGVWMPTKTGSWVARQIGTGAQLSGVPDDARSGFPDRVVIQGRWSVDKKAWGNVFSYLRKEIDISISDVSSRLEAFYRRFMWYPDPNSYTLMATWTMLTYVYSCFDQVPYLAFVGTKRSGKSRAMELLELLCFNASMGTSQSDAYIFRLIEGMQSTLMIDEADSLKMQDKEGANERLEILRMGYKNNGRVGRVMMNADGTAATKSYSVYSPKAIANVSGLEEALEDRVIWMPVARIPNTVTLDKLVKRDLEAEVQEIRNSLYVFGLEYGPRIAERYSVLRPEDLEDREAELWSGLLTIGSFVGDEWTNRLYSIASGNKLRKQNAEAIEGKTGQVLSALYVLVSTQEPDARRGGMEYYSSHRMAGQIAAQCQYRFYSAKAAVQELRKLSLVDDKSGIVRVRVKQDKKEVFRVCYALSVKQLKEVAEKYGVNLEALASVETSAVQDDSSAEPDGAAF